ncbi:SDR family NAD(P)-dependent oxidoreductase [Nonomuraea jiangxiensis]|uniref:NAD(P)-dependent dehydrogenase, short-chain alcohol dehydrogenase family n=1 Tax=Nonomuraea jiangxiensis TaxID=633440 RepID=A0A1G8KBV9_9ACTN|nr:SDR family NAD(P)-dependent oxidoreductase [Nonomuraea jiangxiensis]SDI40350.1 NAD(P)-dependent dehydrogenase, short-chain alcohol dehydrogenase family [Nonomuraea jiangxiensis]
MDMRLTGGTAVVTGASRGIGLAVVQALVAEGMRVVAAARTISPALKESGAVAVTADLSTAGGPAEVIDRALAALGEIDLLVNNVGGGDGGEGQTGGFLGFDDEQWHSTYDLNFLSAVRATRAALPSLLRRGGTVINVSSISARMPHTGPIPYTTSKAALTAFGKALAEEFGPQGVRVATVSPGAVRTSMWEDPNGYGAAVAAAHGVEHERFLAGLPSNTGMTTGRFIEPEEVAALVTYLASPHAGSISGADYVIDGGSGKTV